jgi:hypothetical protein
VEVGWERIFGAEGEAVGADLDSAVSAGGADELLDGSPGAVLVNRGAASAAKTTVRWALIEARLLW